MTWGESLEEEDEELKKYDIQFHHFLKKRKHFHLGLKVKDHLLDEEENHFQKNEENHYCLDLTSIIEEKRIQVS